MKYLLTIMVVVLFVVNCSAQFTDSIKGSGFGFTSGIGATITPLHVLSLTINNDTVRCLMLISDTSDISNNKVVWIKGWEVNYHIFYYNYGDTLPTPMPQFLDIIKQPLSKSIIVWMSKEY